MINNPFRRTTLVLALGASIALLGACDAELSFGLESVDGSGNIETRTYDLQHATSLDVANNFDVHVRIDSDSQPSAALSIDDNLFGYVDVKVVNGELRLGPDRGMNLDTDRRPQVEVVLTTLEEIDISGGSIVSIEGLDEERLFVDASGGSLLRAEGTVGHLTIDMSGGSNGDLAELHTTTTDADLSGGSDLEVFVQDRLSVDSSGGSDVGYLGSPILELDTSGSSKVTNLG